MGKGLGLATAIGWITSSAAMGCPVCDTETGAAVRAGIASNGWGWPVFGILAPIVIAALFVAKASDWLAKEG